MERNAIFRLASLTKPLVAATALAMVDRGLLRLDDSVTDYLPYFTPVWDNKPARITVRHLMTHTSGLSYDEGLLAEVEASSGLAGPIIPLEENARRIGRMRLKFAPGMGWEYSVATDLLGCVIATINPSTLDEAVQRYVTGPLGMHDTRFFVTDLARLAVPYNGPPNAVRTGDAHRGKNPDGSPGHMFCPSRIFNPQAHQSGGAGMAGTGDDFLKLIEAIRTGGAPILSEKVVAEALRNQIGDLPRPGFAAIGRRFGLLGAVLDDPVAARSPQARRHTKLERRLWPQLVLRPGQRVERCVDEQHCAGGQQRTIPRRGSRCCLRSLSLAIGSGPRFTDLHLLTEQVSPSKLAGGPRGCDVRSWRIVLKNSDRRSDPPASCQRLKCFSSRRTEPRGQG